MSADLVTLLIAVALPLLTVAALVRLVAGVGDLERSRDELIDLGIPGR
jgi:hypothetical protein